MSADKQTDKPIPQKTSCADDWEPSVLSVEEAKNRILEHIDPITGTEKLALRSCLNRFLATDVFSPVDVPAHPNSAMDGYAIAGSDLPVDEDRHYQIIDTCFAGKPSSSVCREGQVIRIMTGGLIPKGTDTVIMQEQVKISDDGRAIIKSGHKIGQNVRLAGEDIPLNTKVLAKGHQINMADLGILASLGIGELRVFRRPRVAFFSTGDELRSIGETLNEGEIYDSNRYTLYAMLKQQGVDIIDMGVIPDEPDTLKNAFLEATEMSDMVITSGGVSVGEADYIKPTLKALGDISFWKIRMKPGRPLTFGALGQAKFFGLPGNPVAVMVTFLQFVKPALYYLASGKNKPQVTLKAKSLSKLYKRPGRYEFQRGIFQQNEDGDLVVKRTGMQGSGILTSMSIANCFILLDENCEGIEEGDHIEIQVFSNTL